MGTTTPGNRVTLCRFHHQRGEHGGAMRVRGTAPLELEFTLGGEVYRNERRMDRKMARPRGLEPLTS